MTVEIIAIGDEVLQGFTTNSNAQFLAQKVLEVGCIVIRHEVVRDDRQAIEEALFQALKRGSIVITTGGLGPTLDDCTREAAAAIFHRKLLVDATTRKKISERFPRAKDEIVDNQARLPEGAELFDNPLGTASGFALERNDLFGSARLICLPGVPIEMRRMCVDHAIPYIVRHRKGRLLYIHALHFAGLKEDEVNPSLVRLTDGKISFGIYPAQGTLTVHIRKEANSRDEFDQEIAQVKGVLEKEFGQYLYDSVSGRIEEAVHKMLVEKNLTLSCAESCTGGALSARFVSLPDASKYFMGSCVAYANEVKMNALHVPREFIEKYGAVSEQVTEAMARGALTLFESDIAVSTSGVFGPTGGSVEKPVGTVCATILSRKWGPRSWTMHLTPDRELNMERSLLFVLSELYRYIKHFTNN